MHLGALPCAPKLVEAPVHLGALPCTPRLVEAPVHLGARDRLQRLHECGCAQGHLALYVDGPYLCKSLRHLAVQLAVHVVFFPLEVLHTKQVWDTRLGSRGVGSRA